MKVQLNYMEGPALKVFVCLFFNMAGKIDKVFVSIGLLDYIFLQLHCALL